jgi:uncharacterized protein DUF6636
MLRRVVLGLTAAVSAAIAGGAGAQDFMGAQTPSHNIYCQAAPPSPDTGGPELRCDIQHATSRPPRPPRSCQLSWGDAFVVDSTGPGRLMCHGDTTANPNDPVIAYGQQWRAYGFICTSQTSGLTCVNTEGHGFSISRAAQKVF